MRRFLVLLSIVASIAATPLPHPLGWHSSPHGIKADRQLAQHPLFRAAPLPAAASVQDGMPPIYDQLDLGSCVANAGDAAFEYQWKKRTGSFVYPSRLDTYQQCLRHDRTFPADSGTTTTSCLWVFRNKGVLTERTWPYVPANLADRPPPLSGWERKLYAAVTTYDVSNRDHGYSLKQSIANAHLPVMVGGWVTDQIFYVQHDNPFIPDPKGPNVGGHELLAVAYDDDLVHDGIKGWVLLRNSWGSWGKDGYAWISQRHLFNPHRFEDFGAVSLTGPRVVKHRVPAAAPAPAKGLRWPWSKNL